MFRNRPLPRAKSHSTRRQNQRFFKLELLETRILLAADFGDAPQGITVDGVMRNYPTTISATGAQHGTGGPFLGVNSPDMEADGQPNATATGDDNNGVPDDEDGFQLSGDTSGSGMVLPGEDFTASVTLTGTGFVNAWVDFNNNGDWNDANERVADNEPFNTFGFTVTEDFMGTVPSDATPGTTFLRIRVSSEMLSSPGGTATDGEVEDYVATILSPPCDFIVTTADDVVSSTDGVTSLREAITCANNATGLDTITFNIPGTGPHTIEPNSALPAITDPVIINGYSQSGAMANNNAFGQGLNTVLMVELSGVNAGSGVSGLVLQTGSTGSTIQGLAINRFDEAGVELTGSDDHRILGNFIGTNVTGTAAAGNSDGVAIIDSSGNTIGGNAAGAANVISGNSLDGVAMEGSTSSQNMIRGNLIGVDVTGIGDIGNSGNGVDNDSGSGNTVGGNNSGDGNVIGFNGQNGVFMSTPETAGNTIAGNFIGTDPTGLLNLGNTLNGVSFLGTGFNTVGSASQIENEGNIIAFNGGDGIRNEFGFGVSFFKSYLNNRIYSNGGLGINLVGGTEDSFGVTANDFQDSDTGANNLQNYPVLTSAITGTTTVITGTLNSLPSTTFLNMFRIEFFANSAADPSGHGEGETILGTLDVATDVNGDAPIVFDVETALADGLFISATATNISSGDTSEFSLNVVTESESAACSFVVNTFDDVVSTTDSFNSLREAITCANITSGPQSITLAPGIYVLSIAGASEDDNATGDLDITDDLTIQSATGIASEVTITGLDDSGESPESLGDRIFNVHQSVVNFTGLTIRDGRATSLNAGPDPIPDFGGGILNLQGSVTLTNSVVTDNFGSKGGGIATIGAVPATLILDNTVVSNNRAQGNEFSFPEGGGVYALEDSVTIRNNSRIANNRAELAGETEATSFARGGGVSAHSGTLDISNSFIEMNEANAVRQGTGADFPASGFAEGGGIYMDQNVEGEFTLTLVRGNTARVINPNEITGFGGRADGGGIWSAGELQMSECQVDLNSAIGGSAVAGGTSTAQANGGRGWGGGIFNAGLLTIVDSLIADNSATGGDSVTVSDDDDGVGGSAYGGGIYSGGVALLTSLTVRESRVARNFATGGGEGSDGQGAGGNGYGGGIYSSSDATAIFASLIDANEANGGLGGSGPGGEGEGGGVWLRAPSDAGLSQASLTNSTVSGNFADTLGGGVYVGVAIQLQVEIVNATIVNNTIVDNGTPNGAGIFHDGTTSITLNNTLVAQNIRAADTGVPDDLFGNYTGQNNLIGTGDNSTGLVNNQNGNKVGTILTLIDPMIGELAQNGGTDPTHALLPGSPAIDMGNNDLAVDIADQPIEFDQRGTGFPRIVNTTVDIGAFEATADACTLIVTNTNDSGIGSLRDAIVCANEMAGLDTITFEIPGNGPHVIQPISELPAITDPLFINGYSQGSATGTTADDATPNTLGPFLGTNAVLKIVIDGVNAAGAVGLILNAGSAGSTIRGLNIQGFDDDGIQINSANNTIAGNFIGTTVTGTAAAPNDDEGVQIAGFGGNVVGGEEPADVNVISGNAGDGVNIRFQGANGTRVENNYIGTNAAGTAAILNVFEDDGDDGVDIDSSSNNVVIGNVISGNPDDGVEIDGGDDFVGQGDATGNMVQGNRIGTNAAGTMAIANGDDGVSIEFASGNFIGGDSEGQGNWISGNNDNGVVINQSNNNTVQGNTIGTNLAGDAALANDGRGVAILSGNGNLIGGTGEGEGNLISGNTSDGVVIAQAVSGEGFGPESSFNVVQGNRIGIGADGSPIGNGFAGVAVLSGDNNSIGGTAAAAANVIAFNNGTGVVVSGFSTNNPILGNSIFANSGLGIDLEEDGVTPNDAPENLDEDFGGNNLQNFPVLTSVSGSLTSVITGTLNSLPNENFRIEFFANDMLDPSGFGEGQEFLGFVNVFTDDDGFATITFDADQFISPTRSITSTATYFEFELIGEEEGEGEIVPMIFLDTSEFSAAAPIQELADLSLEKTIDTPSPEENQQVTFTITVTNAGTSAATNVEVTDFLPDGLVFVMADASQGGVTLEINDDADPDVDRVIWNVGTLDASGPGATATLEIVVTVLTTEQLTNIAEVTASDQFDPNSTPNNRDENPNEDDTGAVGVGACLFGLDGPLVVGVNRLVYTCPTPGSISAFVMGTEFGSFYYELYDQTVDIADPTVKALGVANQNGVAVVHVTIPAAMANSQIIFQAFEMVPNTQLSNTLVMNVGSMPLQAEGGQGTGSEAIFRSDVHDVFAEAIARWKATDLTPTELARLNSATFRLLDLPEGLVGSALNTTVYLDRTAAGHGWFVDSTPASDSEFELAVSSQERITTSSTALSRIDLLTVIMHELGHVLGHSDEPHQSAAAPGLMDHMLPQSTRRLATDLAPADLSRPLHNYDFHLDVDLDGRASLGDAFEIVAQLRANGTRRVADIVRQQGLRNTFRFDVSGDNLVSLEDAFLIVAHLRQTRLSEAQGEGELVVAPVGKSAPSAGSLEAEASQSLAEAEASHYESAVDAVLASYADDDDS